MRYLVMSLLLLSNGAFAQKLDFTEMCARMEVVAEVFTFDTSGKFLDKKKEYQRSSVSKPWSSISEKEKCSIGSGWSSKWDDKMPTLALRYELELRKDLTLELTIKQFSGHGRQAQKDKPIKEEKFRVDNMKPVMWKSVLHKDPVYVVRFTPNLSFREKPRDIGDMEISGRNIIITDKKGFVWTDEFSIKEKYISVKTHRGSVALSYLPFKGASLIGEAHSNVIWVEDEKGTSLKLTAENSFLPDGITGNVYGLFSRKTTKKIGSVSAQSSDKEKEFVERIKSDF